MREATRFTERVRDSLREQLLDAAADLLPERGFQGLRMADVAAETGVSRQTVYNEFGNKETLVTAVALRTEAALLAESDRRLSTAPELLDGVRDSLAWTIEHARENTLVAAILGAGPAGDLLPFLTSALGAPLLHSAVDVLAGVFGDRAPQLPERAARWLAEQSVRLALSHVAMPTSPPLVAANAITEMLAPHLSAGTE